ncbi:MAG: hypothetical protein Kow0074_24900 [Candidatus Zixiibacteriota bacterium]
MLSLLFASMLVCCAVLGASVEGVAEDDVSSDTGSATITWHHSFAQAQSLARETERHIIAEFYTDWCPWCRKLDDSTLAHPLVEAMADSFVFLRVNAELDTALVTRYGVNAYPTVILIEGNGNEVDRIVGYVQPEEFVERINKYLLGEGTLWALEKLNRERPSDPETIYKLARKHMERGAFDKARPLFEKAVNLDKDNKTGFADSAQFSIALMYRKEKQWFKAIEEFRIFLETFPKSDLREDAELYIPWLNARAGDNEEALEGYRGFLDDHSGSSEAEWVRQQIAKLEAGEEPSENTDETSSPDK